MALEDILKKIRADSEEKAKKIKEDAQQRAQKIIANARSEAERLAQELEEKAKLHAQQEKNRIITLANLELRKDLLKQKQELMEHAFSEAYNRLKNMNGTDYQKLMKKLIVQTVETNDEEIIVSANRRDLFTKEFIDEINACLSSHKRDGTAKKDASLKLSDEVRDFPGGFILRRGKSENNLTFDTIMQNVREKIETEVAEILFGEMQV